MMTRLPLDDLLPHPHNSNVMPAALLDKLVEHIERTGRYPPLIVRPMGQRFQLLDGHHRAAALRRLRRTHADCVVWPVDDAEALVLLATLNRLEGADDPVRRSGLLAELRRLAPPRTDLAALLPESAAELERLARLGDAPAPAPPANDLPQAIHFFVTADQRRAIEAKLAATGPDRTEALLTLLQLTQPSGTR